METTVKSKEFREIFQNSLKMNARSMSIKTLLSERNLDRINYKPYYQRNYVWEKTKQTFFIESVILGTEVPPLILFKTGPKIEVIDGRQRFETLKRFKENGFPLSITGLNKLRILKDLSFNKLDQSTQEIFLNSNIRIFEFEVINHPNINEDVIDLVKKEIFRRYNTGITPLSREELDNAKYDEDAFSDFFKDELKNDREFANDLNECFFPRESAKSDVSEGGLTTKNIDFIRKFRVLSNFPIYTYASGSGRSEMMELMYDFIRTSESEPEQEFEKFKSVLKEVLSIYREMSSHEGLNNKLIYECILWALIILRNENIEFEFNLQTFVTHYQNNLHLYGEDGSYFYMQTVNRFNDTADFFENITKFDFSKFIKDASFRKKIARLKQTDFEATQSIEELSNLRLNKTNPVSIPIDEIRNDVKTSRYLLRPSYQRQEKISIYKSSAIIESILLGINLPPLFVYTNPDKIKEVVDGQQRLLAILGFLGEAFINEDGKENFSKNNHFKLTGLKILTDLEGKSYYDLDIELRDKIVDFVLDVIIIESAINEAFDPIDLFIRLNYKPYPIKNNSFEMWNSIVNNEVIKRIKEVTDDDRFKWFHLRERVEGKADRMLNEELITVLTYMTFNKDLGARNGLIGFYLKQDRINCMFTNKKGLSDFLLSLDKVHSKKEAFLATIDETENLIELFGGLFPNNPPTKEELNEFLNVKGSQSFRRTFQDFYVIWLVISKLPTDKFKSHAALILEEVRQVLSTVKNTDNKQVNTDYLENLYMQFENSIERISGS